MTPDTPAASQLAPKLLTMFFAMVMMTDTGAYYTGRSLGRHKLAPRVSPGKTVEGSVGGFVAAVLTGPLCKLIFFPEIPVLHAATLGATIGIWTVGDGRINQARLERERLRKPMPGTASMIDGRLDTVSALRSCTITRPFFQISRGGRCLARARIYFRKQVLIKPHQRERAKSIQPGRLLRNDRGLPQMCCQRGCARGFYQLHTRAFLRATQEAVFSGVLTATMTRSLWPGATGR